MPTDPQAKADKLYHDILDILEDLAAVYVDAEEMQAEEDAEKFDPDDLLDSLVEEATERGLDEEASERAFKAIAALGKKAVEA